MQQVGRLNIGASLQSIIGYTLLSSSLFTDNGSEGGTGSALLSLRYPVNLAGSNAFKRNTGGAITILQTFLDISGEVRFEGNVARDGGGIRMLEYSYVSSRSNEN